MVDRLRVISAAASEAMLCLRVMWRRLLQLSNLNPYVEIVSCCIRCTEWPAVLQRKEFLFSNTMEQVESHLFSHRDAQVVYEA